MLGLNPNDLLGLLVRDDDGWKRPREAMPRRGMLVFCLAADMTKHVLSFDEGGWRDQDGHRYMGAEVRFWHPLPHPPSINEWDQE